MLSPDLCSTNDGPASLNKATPLVAALAYAELGWPVFPLRPRSKTPATVHGFKDATTDADQIRKWWDSQPDAGIGLSCVGFVVLDVDVKGAKKGDLQLLDLIREHGGIGWTWQAMTPSKGMHFYFRAEGVKRTIGKLAPALDILGEGGFVVAPPTTLEAGQYHWLADGASFSPPSDWLLRRMRSLSEPEPEPTEVYEPSWERGTMRSAERCLRYVDKMPIAVSGQNGSTDTFKVACVAVRGFSLPDSAALEVLRYYSSKCSPPWSEREIRHKLNQAKAARDFQPGYLLEARV